MEPQAGKRIVSKGEYARIQGKRLRIGSSAFILFVLMGLCVMLTLVRGGIAAGCLSDVNSNDNKQTAIFCLGWLVFLLPLSYLLAKWTRTTFIRARQIDPGVPLTRANTADLPAQDTLVRASEEPRQKQEDVLLRAVIETQERHEEQLVRASADWPE